MGAPPKKALRIMSFECRSAHSNPLHFRYEIIKIPDKIIMENCLFISKSINFNLSSIFNHWFILSSEWHNYETSSASKGLLKVNTVKTKKYGKEAMIKHLNPSFWPKMFYFFMIIFLFFFFFFYLLIYINLHLFIYFFLAQKI